MHFHNGILAGATVAALVATSPALALPTTSTSRGAFMPPAQLAFLDSASSPVFGLTEKIFSQGASWLKGILPGTSSSKRPQHKLPKNLHKNLMPNATSVSSPVFVTYGDSDNGGATGVPDDPYSELAGFTHYNIAFWTWQGGPQDQAQKWANTDKATQQHYAQVYHDAGIKLMVSAFGANDKPQGSGASAVDVANAIASFVKDNNLDGVDVDYEESDLMSQGQSLAWLVQLQQTLRQQLPSPQYVITHAPLAPWFSYTNYKDGGYAGFDTKVGSSVDWYNVQYYNQGLYDDCNGLLNNSGGWSPDSSLFQSHNQGGVPLERLVVGKPATAQDADVGGSGYIEPATLGQCLATARKQGYNSGVMIWEYPHATASLLATVKQNAGW